jgi:hypothetical protein
MQIRKLMYAAAIASAVLATPAMAQADNTDSRIAPATPAPFKSWMSTYSHSNDGRISRQAYMDEAGRRWDAMDRDQRGLTPDQINRMYGYGSGGAPTPNRVKKGNSTTNPTGTELKGESGG